MSDWRESGAKAHLEIRYCLPCGFGPTAAWIASEFWSEFKADLADSLTPVKDGRLELILNDEVLYNNKTEGVLSPDLNTVRQLKTSARGRLEVVLV